jgi:colanic acid/amylovoran biosynthesis glycosyltransferase
MRIAFVLGSFPALSETFILNQITGLIDRGQIVDIYASGPRDDPKVHPDVERYGLIGRTFYLKEPLAGRLGDFGGRLLAAPGATLVGAVRNRLWPREMRALRLGVAPLTSPPAVTYDVVHCHFGASALAALTVRKAGLLAGPLVTTFYGADVTRYVVRHGEAAYAGLFKEGEAFLAICEAFRARLIRLGCAADRIHPHRLGIDLGRFPFLPRQLAAGEAVRMVSIARLEEKKGLEYVLRALARVQTAVRIEYTIIGDGSLRAPLERLAAQVPAGVRVRFAGWLQQEEVAATLRGAHLLIAPSVTAASGDQEGTPVAILEAMASGLPVIATHHSGIPELVQDRSSGRLVPERDVASLCEAIEELVAAPGTWVAMGHAGRARVEQRHDINQLNDALVQFYQQLVAGTAMRASHPGAAPRSHRDASEHAGTR